MRALLAGLIAVCVGLTTALISPTAKAADPYLTVSMTRTDTYGAPVRGEVLTFSISYTNVSTRVVTATPSTSSNLAETLPPTAPNCRYANLAARATAGCSTAKHIVTAADVATSSFTPTVTFDATTTRDGSTVLQSGITVALPAIATEAGDPRDPQGSATVPTEREDGEYVTLGTANYMGFTCHRIRADPGQQRLDPRRLGRPPRRLRRLTQPQLHRPAHLQGRRQVLDARTGDRAGEDRSGQVRLLRPLLRRRPP